MLTMRLHIGLGSTTTGLVLQVISINYSISFTDNLFMYIYLAMELSSVWQLCKRTADRPTINSC